MGDGKRMNKQQYDFFLEISKYPNIVQSYDDLAERLAVSTRTVRNYAAAISAYAAEIGIEEVIIQSHNGLSYTGSQEKTNRITARIVGGGFYKYRLSQDERILARMAVGGEAADIRAA